MALGQQYLQQYQSQPQQSTMKQPHPIAPAPMGMGRPTTVLGMNGINLPQQQFVGGLKQQQQKYSYKTAPYDQPASVVKRNARERNRVRQVNSGFVNLRQHIPQSIVTELTNGGRGASKKLSKVDTLRLAVEYIRRLQDLIEESDSEGNSSICSQSSTAGSPPPPVYYPSSPESMQSVNQFNQYSDSSISPTPSFQSEIDNCMMQTSTQTQQVFKFENFQPESPNDDELLDYISMWQEN